MKGGIMSAKGFFERSTFILVGIAIAISFFILTGATTETQVGRYQISTSVKRDFVDVYIVDTLTGAVKYVDPRDENKPFEEIKSR
jgi:F0F1-type ATP synthase membrane subunit a